MCPTIACSVAGMGVRAATKDTMIMLGPVLLVPVLVLVILWPAVSLRLPGLILPERLR